VRRLPGVLRMLLELVERNETVSPLAATDAVSAPISRRNRFRFSDAANATSAASATVATVAAFAFFDVPAIVPILSLFMPEAWPPPCLPEARERSAERGAAIGEHGRAARQARWIGRIGRVTTMRRLARARPCHRAGGSRGERWPRPSLPANDRQGFSRSRSRQSERSSPHPSRCVGEHDDGYGRRRVAHDEQRST
jgi:hypothetical protein